MIIYDGRLKVFRSTKINDDSYLSGFGTVVTGDARITDNIVNFLRSSNTSYTTVFLPEQIHSTNIEQVEGGVLESTKQIDDTDGLITKEQSLVLTVVTADCVPIIYVDKKKGITAISHQGWRGSLKRLPEKLIGKMIALGSNPKDIIAAIGPAIGQCCYDVDDDHYYTFLEEFNGYSEQIFIARHGRKYLNLNLLNYLVLKDAGLIESNIDFFPFCTKCDARFFSVRRLGKHDSRRQFSLVLRRK